QCTRLLRRLSCLISNGYQRVANQQRFTRCAVEREHGAGIRRGDFNERVGGFDFGDWLVDGDGVAFFDEPVDEVGLCEAFTQGGNVENLCAPQCPPVVAMSTCVSSHCRSSMASKIRSTLGR